MAAILPQGKTQFFDANGNPLTGGSVTFYAKGTTTYQNTYQDSALSILNANPVVLDSAGFALIWAAGGSTFTTIVKDQYGNQIYQADTTVPYSSASDFGGAGFIAASATLTAAQSGQTILTDGATAAFKITLPTNAAGLNYAIYGNASYAVTVAALTGNIILPDGTSATSFVLPLSAEDSVTVFADGTNWRAFTRGRQVVAAAVNKNEAVQRGQVLSAVPFGASTYNTAATTITATTGTFTAPANGYIVITATGQLNAVQYNNTNFSATASLATPTLIMDQELIGASWYLPINSGQATTITVTYFTASSGGLFLGFTCFFTPSP